MELIIGIDPGKSGAIVVLNKQDGSVVEESKMPETAFDVLSFIKKYSSTSCFCYLEKVGSMPGNGGVAMFSFGKGVGHLEMALLSSGIAFEEVTPQKWQKEYQLGSRVGTKSEWKNKLKNKAQQLFPKVKVTLANADALLIAEYGRRKNVK